jgi:hypothetical protein
VAAGGIMGGLAEARRSLPIRTRMPVDWSLSSCEVRGRTMWPLSEMVAQVLVQEREQRQQTRAELVRMSGMEEQGIHFESDPIRTAGLVFVLLVLMVLGPILLI